MVVKAARILDSAYLTTRTLLRAGREYGCLTCWTGLHGIRECDPSHLVDTSARSVVVCPVHMLDTSARLPVVCYVFIGPIFVVHIVRFSPFWLGIGAVVVYTRDIQFTASPLALESIMFYLDPHRNNTLARTLTRSLFPALELAGYVIDGVWDGESRFRVRTNLEALDHVTGVDFDSALYVRNIETGGRYTIRLMHDMQGLSPGEYIVDWSDSLDSIISPIVSD